ncbi:MAG TPA: ribosome small subunit-dependent GTPase A [Candidatus Brocadiia bacterium]|nr:ribosome small subunit-dependent GTPase A [Candidatus Brocadiia bacterium]
MDTTGQGEGADGRQRIGRIARIDSVACHVDDGERIFLCKARSRLTDSPLEGMKALVVGDDVDFMETGAKGEGVIEKVLPRRSKLSRARPDKDGFEQIIVANVTRVVIVASVACPDSPPGLIDRYVISAESAEVTPMICINKTDLAGDDAFRPMGEYYRGIGYEVIYASAVSGRGIEELRGALSGETAVFAGHSGVGKSSLINAVQPGLNLRVMPVHEQSGEGRHTTTWVSLMRLAGGGYIVDTPGIREFALWDLRPQDIPCFYKDFFALGAKCAMRACEHIHESGCAVKSAIQAGEIPHWRYESYLRVRESVSSPEVYRSRAVERAGQVPLGKRRASRRGQKQRLRRQIMDFTADGEGEESDT